MTGPHRVRYTSSMKRSRHRNIPTPSFIRVLGAVLLFVVLLILLPPMFRASPPEGKINRAKVDVRSISTAVTLFVNDYGRFPIPLGLADVDQPGPAPGETARRGPGASAGWAQYSENILRVLTAQPNESFTDSAWHDLNPEGKVYLYLERSPWQDPWGGTYAIRLHLKYREPEVEGGSSFPPRALALARSAGPSGRFDDPNASARQQDDVANQCRFSMR